MSPGKRSERSEEATKLDCNGSVGISSPKEDEVTAARVAVAQVAAQVVAVEVVVNDPEVERKVQAHLANRAERVRRRANLRRVKLLLVKLERVQVQLLIRQRHQRQRQRPHRRRALQLRNKAQKRVVVAAKADAVVEVLVERAVEVSVGDAPCLREPIAWY
jgi:hypothetical protein